MKIKYVDLSRQFLHEKKIITKIFHKVLKSGNYVGGEFVSKFEKKIETYLKIKNCISLNSGTDALLFSLFSCGIKKGDEVITVPNSFISTTSTIVHLGAKPVFVDVLNDQNINPREIEKKITKKTKAIIPVHLTGRVCKMDIIMQIAKKYNLKVIEDAAQAIGSKYKNKFAGTFGDFGCFSAHPLKNLNAIGDSGFVITNNNKVSNFLKDIRNNGMANRDKVKNFGYVSRMDNLQASVLEFRIKNLKNIISKRRKNASIYQKYLDPNFIFFPSEKEGEFNTYHTFVIQVDKRDKLKKFLNQMGIGSSIHYPVPIHLQPAAKILGYKLGDFPLAERQSRRILSLPIHQFLKEKEIIYISKLINKFYEKKLF